jgi:hypothetical protein
LPSLRGPTGSDVIQIEWALIDRPVGDRYINDDLWALANEQIVPLERKDLLQDNGLRVAQLGGLLPAEFQQLLRSERYNPNPRRRQLRAGQVATLALGPLSATCDLRPPSRSVAGGEDLRHLTNAQFSLALTATLASDDKVRLAFTPQIQHGECKAAIKPAEDGSGWTCGEQAVAEKFGELAFEATLAANEYLLVGCWFKSEQTYGKGCFVRIEEAKPVQRLLVIRTGRQLGDWTQDSAAETSGELPATIAAQASGNAAHAKLR